MSNATTTDYESFQIPEGRVKELQEKIDKLNKKAAKLGTPAIEMIVTSNKTEKTVEVGGQIAAMRRSPIWTYTTVEVLIKGETPKLNGWEFLSVVMHRPAGNDFLNLTDGDADLSEFVFTDKHCDHCQKNRVRNATFLVRHEGGQIKQVGSTCLTDYTGVKSPQAHAAHIENILTLLTGLRNGWGGSTAGRTTRKFFLSEWMAWVNKTVRERGFYVGGDRAEEMGESTTGWVTKTAILAALEDPNAVAPTDADYKLADEQIAWVRSEEGREVMTNLRGDFGTQMLAATRSDDADAVAENTMMLVAPLAAFYARAQREKNKAQTQATQEYFGSVGDRLNLVLTVERVGKGWPSDYGWTRPVNFVDDKGRKFAWFCTGSTKIEQGVRYEVRGTVKRHDIDKYTGDKTTYLNRCKLEPVTQGSLL